jgi:hypothetical protein
VRPLRRTSVPLAAALAGLLSLSACTSLDRPTIQADQVALPTAMSTFGPSVADTISALEGAVASIGERLVVPTAPYRAAEPEALLQVPRTVRRVDLADPDDGYVVIYQAAGQQDAERVAQDLADFLGSGVGQANFTPDTQFSVSVLDDTVVFTSWSAERSDDPARAQAAFDALATVGEAVAVHK